MTHRVHKTEKEIREELHAIYQDQRGEIPNLRELDPVRSSQFRRVIVRVIGVLAVLSLVSWSGFMLWTRGIFHTQKTLETSINGPREIRAGEETAFTIRYANTGAVPMAALEMKLNLPPDFTLVSAQPQATREKTWTLGSLTPGSDGAILLSGVFNSQVPSTSTLQAFFTYRPANFSSEFQDIQTATININQSVLEVAVTGPPKTLSGDDVIYTINVQNTSRASVEGATVILLSPNDFLLTKAEPAPTAPDVSVWNVPTLESGQLFAITLRGRYTASANGEQKMEARVSFLKDGVNLAQANATAITDVIGSTVAFHLVLNGSTEDRSENLGDTLHVSVDYKNTSDEVLSDVLFTLTLNPIGAKELPVVWDPTSLGGGIQKGNVITWNKTAVPDFARLAPDATGVFDLRIPLVESLDQSRMTDHFSLKLSVSFARVGSITKKHTIETSPMMVTLNSNLSTTAEARYYTTDGEAAGSGPLPPKVDATTSYRIVWFLTNTLHPLKETVVTTTLPSHVTWINRTETAYGTVSFDEPTRVVTWRVQELPANLGTASATFDISITPKTHDVGSFVKLINATSVETIDVITQARLTRSMESLTTELPTDQEAAGKGIVVE